MRWGWLGGGSYCWEVALTAFVVFLIVFLRFSFTFGMRWGWLGGGSYCWEVALTAFVVLLIVFLRFSLCQGWVGAGVGGWGSLLANCSN